MTSRFLFLWFLGVSLAAAFSRAQLAPLRAARCSLDGLPIDGASRIDFIEVGSGGQRSSSFCSVECALSWPGRSAAGARGRFVVHEERHGTPLDPGAAFFVRTPARAAGGRSLLRAFADPLSAAEYARAFDAVLVPNPFPQDR